MQIDGQPKITCVATSEVTTMLVTSAGRSDKYDQWQSGKVGKIHGAMRFGRGWKLHLLKVWSCWRSLNVSNLQKQAATSTWDGLDLIFDLWPACWFRSRTFESVSCHAISGWQAWSMPGVTIATGRLAWKVARRTDCDATSPLQPLFSGFLKGRFELIGVCWCTLRVWWIMLYLKVELKKQIGVWPFARNLLKHRSTGHEQKKPELFLKGRFGWW